MVERTILHCDLNAFYASVELLALPHLREKPVAVCGDPKSRHGIILAKNEHAKKFGVATAETIERAKRKCPQLVLIPPHYDRYADFSEKANSIYGRYTDLIEPFGIDESWLDITHSMHLFGGESMEVARRISAAVKDELGLTISIGVSFCKVIAKLGSDLKKPDGITEITRQNYANVVFPLAASSLLYIGKVAQEALSRLGIRTIGDLAHYDRETLILAFGKGGAQMHDYANGVDDAPVSSQRDVAKSIGNGMTFRRDLIGLEDIKIALSALCESVAARLRAQGMMCSTVQLMVRDPAFKTISRQQKLERPTHLAKEMRDAALRIMQASWNLSKPIRMLTVTGMQLVPMGELCEQMVLLEDGSAMRRERLEKLETTVAGIRDRYGSDAILAGRLLGNDIGVSMTRRPHEEGEEDPHTRR